MSGLCIYNQLQEAEQSDKDNAEYSFSESSYNDSKPSYDLEELARRSMIVPDLP